MSDYDNTNTGTLFRDDKRTNDRAPEFTGTLNVEGKEYRIAAWVKESTKTGKKFFSLKVEEPRAQTQKASPESDPFGDVPF
jgi:uncharacterized protein (DUF736 family)